MPGERERIKHFEEQLIQAQEISNQNPCSTGLNKNTQFGLVNTEQDLPGKQKENDRTEFIF